MSGMILCRTREAVNPLILNHMGLKIYTLEELCYYIYNNIYLIGADLIDERLITFIREETGETALSDRLEYLLKEKAGLAEMVVTILKYVDYYNVTEIEEIRDILETLNTQNIYERLKARADGYLKNECYYSAIKNYDKIIQGERDTTLTGLFYAKVYHNMGVCYAKMFLYSRAATYFDMAYRIGQHEESKKCFLAATFFARGNDVIENEDATEQEYVLRREIKTLMDNAQYSDESRKLQAVDHMKEDGQVTDYYKNLDELMLQWKSAYLKYTS
jgi:tetratricopeptide (TPR) repeat protein